jgi:uncharacterized lipoprotein NlpE involved in copper resistance
MMYKLIIAVTAALGLMGCASNSLPKGVYVSPFIMVGSDAKPSNPAPVVESDPS